MEKNDIIAEIKQLNNEKEDGYTMDLLQQMRKKSIQLVNLAFRVSEVKEEINKDLEELTEHLSNVLELKPKKHFITCIPFESNGFSVLIRNTIVNAKLIENVKDILQTAWVRFNDLTFIKTKDFYFDGNAFLKMDFRIYEIRQT